MNKDNYIIPHYPFYNEPKLVAESQRFVQDVRSLLEKIDAEYAIPDELNALKKNDASLTRVVNYVVAKQQGQIIDVHNLTPDELKVSDYYLKAGDKGKRVSLICNELFGKMVIFTISLDTHAKNYRVDETLKERYDEIIKSLHDCVDGLNSKYGNEKELCLCCHSNKTAGDGIKHEISCPLSMARRITKL